MGYYGINILIKRKDNNMINELKEVSLKSLDMIVKNADGLKFKHANKHFITTTSRKFIYIL